MTAVTNNNFQDYDPRHRLTGAVVLILLAIVILPMLLGEKSSNDTETAMPVDEPVVMEIRKEGTNVFVSRISSAKDSPNSVVAANDKADVRAEKTADIVPSSLFKPPSLSKPDQSTKKAATKTKAAPVAKKKTETKSTAKPVTKSKSSSTTSKKAAATKKASVNKKPSAIPAGSWILQVGVFSQSANANKKVSDLKKKGFLAKTAKVKTSKGTATKVWIGPFKDRKTAEKMQGRLQHKTRQRGIVIKTKS